MEFAFLYGGSDYCQSHCCKYQDKHQSSMIQPINSELMIRRDPHDFLMWGGFLFMLKGRTLA